MKHFLFILIVLFSWAVAQSPDSLLQSYSLAIESLDQAINVIEEDATVAQEALVRAQLTLRPMSVNSSSPELVKALETTFDHAKIAILNKSVDDLIVQSSVLKGGYWRLLFESVVNSSDTNPALVKSHLLQIAKDMELAEGFDQTLADSTNLLGLLANFEKAIAEKAIAEISLASQSDGFGTIYRHLASAYSLFLPVQDSPRAPSFINALFAKTFQEVVAGDKEVLQTSLNRLSEAMAQFSAASSQFLATSAKTDTSIEELSTTTDTANVAPLDSQAEVTPAVVEETQEAQPEVAISEEAAITAIAAETNDQATNEAQAAEVVVIETSNNEKALLSAFQSHGISAAQQKSLLKLYANAAVVHPSDLQDVFFADSARIAVALENGNQVKAKRLLENMRQQYSSLLAPLNAFHDPELPKQTITLMDNLIKAPSLRVQDAIVLAGQMGATAHGITTMPLMHKAIVSTTNIWAGWVRLIFATIFGILAFVPLYLLILAFGGGNKNWQLVGWSLFLLLLPMIYEGISYLAGLIASLTGLEVLNSLSSFSIFQNSLSQAIWFVLSGIAILLAIAGLYGICVQFGLLGKRSKSGSSGKTTILEPAVTESSVQTNFDWDEEF